MTNLLVLGAGGPIARRAVEMLADEDVEPVQVLLPATEVDWDAARPC